MSDLKFLCPECGQKIVCDVGYSGSEVRCPACQKSIVAPPTVAAPTPITGQHSAATAPAPPRSSASTSVLKPSAEKQPSAAAARPAGKAIFNSAKITRVITLTYPYLALATLLGVVWSAFGSIPVTILIWGAIAFIPMIVAQISNSGSRLVTLASKIGYLGLGLLLVWIGVAALTRHYFSPTIVVRESPDEINKLKPRIVDEVFTGVSQSEMEHRLGGKNLLTGPFNGKLWRSAVVGGSITYTMKVLPDQPMSLNCRYWGGEQAGRTFDVSIDDKVIATQNLEFNVPGHFFDAEYRIPRSLTRGKSEVTVKFQALPGRAAGGLFGCQTLKR
jgi:Family of unknown function (DUF6805)